MSTRNSKANNRGDSGKRQTRLLSRLIGLETEYATLLDLPPDQEHPPSRREVFDAVCCSLAEVMPTAESQHDDCCIFLANGGAVSLESSFDELDRSGGLIEGATPECQSPKKLLAHQRAQDQLLSKAVGDSKLPGDVKLLKNSRDGSQHIYGCQENYSADVASGLTLLLYRTGMLMLFPMYMLYVALCLASIFVSVSVFIAFRVIGSILRARKPRSDDLLNFPSWCLPMAARLMYCLHLPLTAMLWILAKFTAFRPQRKWLTAFLISRVSLCGTGHLDGEGRFSLSGKASAIDSLVGMGGYRGERPIYVFGHWLSTLTSESIISPRCMLGLLKTRQRLQIGIADSNVADAAEYLKVGATSLVLDMIDAGYTKDLPTLRSPLLALDRIAGDWNLIARVETDQGMMSALDIQRLYYSACHKFVRNLGDAAGTEAWEILKLWDEMLDAAQRIRDLPIDFEPALAKIDWASKKWLIDQMGKQASFASQKKVDLRYHELTIDGYFRRLSEAVPAASVLSCEQINNAKRMPPSDSPAARRGQLIREFAGSEMPIRASWSHVVIGTGKSRRTFPLTY